MKRALDLILSLVGLIALSPALFLVMILIRLSDGGPALFVQRRVGRGGREFNMFKFRTMIVNAESKGAQITVGNDQRVTAMGSLLRKTKFDELPQLWNVLLGQMSFVGPRPEVKKYVDLYSLSHREVLKLKPGITDLASFAFFNESELLGQAKDAEVFYLNVLMPEKIRINLEYARQANLATDLWLITATVLRSLGWRADGTWSQATGPALPDYTARHCFTGS